MTVDTGEMVVVHRVFRREFGLLPALVRSVEVGDRARAHRVGTHLADLATGLHHHHTLEDELLWPPLLQRVTLEQALVADMERQHEVVAGLLDQVAVLLPRWRAGADLDTRDALADVLHRISSALDEHLQDEERLVLPLVAEHLTQAEWDALGERGRASLPRGRKALVFLGALLEDATERERVAFLAHLPRPVRLLWRLVGARTYDREVLALRGPLAGQAVRAA